MSEIETLNDFPCYASFGMRALAKLLDGAAALVGFALLAGLLIVFKISSDSAVIGWAIGLWILFYQPLFESSKLQATPGKLVLGLFVTNVDGQRLSIFRAIARVWLEILAGNILTPFIYIVGLFTAKKQCLHDLITHCYVLKKT